MKKFICLFFVTLLAVNVSAQESSEDMFRQSDKDMPRWAGFVSNGFWSNWEISVGAGVGTAFTTGNNIGGVGDRLGFDVNLSLTKWFHPIFGVRGQFQYGRYSNVHSQYGELKWPYLMPHVDAMLNVSNWFGRYRDDRVYYAIPYVGAGLMASNFTDKSQANNHMDTRCSFTFMYGLLNKFRVSKSMDIELDFKGFVAPSKQSPVRSGSYLFGMNASLGVTYRFNKRTFGRAAVVVPYSKAGYAPTYREIFEKNKAELEAANKENERLQNELDDTRSQLADAQDAVEKANAAAAAAEAAAKAAAEQNAATGETILFNYASDKLTMREKLRLDFIAKRINEDDSDRVYQIQGHADAQTGTPEQNQIMSDKRAKAVYQYLLSKGVAEERLEWKGYGENDSPYDAKEANRSVIIK